MVAGLWLAGFAGAIFTVYIAILWTDSVMMQFITASITIGMVWQLFALFISGFIVSRIDIDKICTCGVGSLILFSFFLDDMNDNGEAVSFMIGGTIGTLIGWWLLKQSKAIVTA